MYNVLYIIAYTLQYKLPECITSYYTYKNIQLVYYVPICL